jgi:flagellar hook-basal body complex protein FliE
MTAPIGYPEKFGVILNQKSELNPSGELGKTTPPGDPIGPTFAEQLGNFVSGIDDIEKSAQTQSQKFADGKTNDIHGTMIEVEQAEISLRLLANVRNRVVDIYREVMRMGS